MDFNAYLNLISSEKNLPLILFTVVFALLALLETRFAEYEEKTPRLLRWPSHFLLALFNALLFRLILPGFCLWAAVCASEKRFGLFNQVRVSFIFAVIFTVIFLDWVLYYLHRAYHALPWLWKIHRVHHTDPEVDVTTSLRFHPLEILVTTLMKAFFIYLLGAPVYGVFLFEIYLGISLFFNHSNLHIPEIFEKILRQVIVTPFMHRVHHSANPKETHRNFGFIFSGWDRLFRTYTEPSSVKKLSLGLNLFTTIKFLRLKALILQPFLDTRGKLNFKNFARKD